MNTRHSTVSRTARIAAGSLLAMSALAASTASAFAAKGGSGAIWTTNESCDTAAPQNVNHYAVGETVYLRGRNFNAGVAIGWSITGLPGAASSDPDAVVAWGNGSTDGDGAFCITAYTILDGDAGEYKAEASQGDSSKKDNFRVDPPVEQVVGDTDTGTPPTEDTTPPTEDTTPPTDTTTAPTDTTTPPTEAVEADTDAVMPPAQQVEAETDAVMPPAQQVEAETDAVTPPISIELPPTDTIDGSNDAVPSFLVLGLAVLAGLAVLLAPQRRRTAAERA